MLAHVGIATIQPEKFGPLFGTNWSYVRVQIKRDSENPLDADKIKGIVHPDQDIITGASAWSQALGRGSRTSTIWLGLCSFSSPARPSINEVYHSEKAP